MTQKCPNNLNCHSPATLCGGRLIGESGGGRYLGRLRRPRSYTGAAVASGSESRATFKG